MALALTNGTLASLTPSMVESGTILIEDGRITAVGTPDLDGADVVDCSGKIVMPGNVCAHTHLYSALARGMPAPRRTPHNFLEILQLVWWRLDRALDDNSIRSSALVGAMDAVRSGTTTLFDHHASPNSIDGSLDLLADALEDVGCRGVVCYEVTDRGGKGRRDAGLAENARFLRAQRELIKGMVGAHASFTLDDDSLDLLAEMAVQHQCGVHIHVAEDNCDEVDSLQRSRNRAALRLAGHGILGKDGIAAHGVWLDDEELSTVRGSGSWLVHNCRSNQNNSVGRAPVGKFGARAAVGTDGIDHDMFSESRTAFFRAREDSLDASAEHFSGLLAAGGELASRHFPHPVGRLEPGFAADLMVLDYDPPTPLSSANLSWHWMFALSPRNVESVMVGGNWVLRHGEMCGVDEERVRAEARVEAKRLWARMEQLER
ncbi:MAG: amidohydrolase family protein [Chloroflexota bacterium]